MKNSIVRKLGIVCISVLSIAMVAGCNKKVEVDYGYESKEYITKLGQYKGVTYTPDDRTISDEEVEKNIKTVLEESANWTEYTDQKIEDGDKVVLQIKASDSEGTYLPEFSTSSDYEIVLGSGNLSKKYDDFEEHIVGMIPGRTKQFDVVLNNQMFDSTEYKGKTITFTVAVVEAYKGEYPELTDELVKSVSSGKYTSAKEYRKAIREALEKELQDDIHSARYEEIIGKVMADTEISGYPQDALDKQIEKTTGSMQVYADVYGMTIDEYCKSRFDCTIEEYAQKVILQEMILQEIIEKENLELTAKEYKNNLDAFAKDLGYADGDSLLEKYDAEYIQKNMLMQKAMDFIYDNAVPEN